MQTPSLLVLTSLVKNNEFTQRVFPFLKEEYFEQLPERTLFSIISSYIKRYQCLPSFDAINIELDCQSLKQQVFDDCIECIEHIEKNVEHHDIEWLIDTAEKFCKDRALYLALQQSIEIVSNGKDGTQSSLTETAIPTLLSDAIAVSFDDSIGHDFFEDSEKRYELYHTIESKLPFDIDVLNEITDNGISKKTTTFILAGCVHPDTKVRIRIKKC